MVHDDYEDEDTCEAFTRILSMINTLQKIENSAKYQNVSALEKCKSEIEFLLGEEEDNFSF